MAKRIGPGTPSRSPVYVQPPDGRRLVRWSASAAGLALLVWAGLFAAGMHDVASPGAVTAAHSTAETECATCHKPADAVADLRCERCHDPLDSRRYTNAGHSALATGTWSHAATSDAGCASCHTEHRGREFSVRRVDEGRCVACHQFRSLAAHPEVAAVRAREDLRSPLHFSHEKHLTRVKQTGADRCQTCHQPTSDQRGFEPIDFDGKCASCHLKEGALTLNGTDLLQSGWTPQPVLGAEAGALPTSAPDERGRVIIERMAHRDPTVMLAAERVARVVPPLAVSHQGRQLRDGIMRLSAVTLGVSTAELSDDDLQTWHERVTGELSAIDAQRGGTPDSVDELNALASALDPSAPSIPPAPPASAAAPGAASDPTAFEARRQEIDALLTAIAARAGSDGAQRAARLREQLAALAPTSGTTADTTALLAQLDALDRGMRTLRGAGAGSAALEIDAELTRARRQIAGGLPADAHDQRRWELFALLDTIGPQAAAPVRARVAELMAAAGTMPADSGDTRSLRRDQKQRVLDRLELERVLRQRGSGAAPTAAATSDRTVASVALAQLRSRLSLLSLGGPAAPIEPARAVPAALSLLDACLKCHRSDDQQTGLRPVNLVPAPTKAVSFSHRPHVLQEACETCHSGVATSKAGTDVNLPSIEKCQTCHTGARAPSTCTTCHVYHARSASDIVMAAVR